MPPNHTGSLPFLVWGDHIRLLLVLSRHPSKTLILEICQTAAKIFRNHTFWCVTRKHSTVWTPLQNVAPQDTWFPCELWNWAGVSLVFKKTCPKRYRKAAIFVWSHHFVVIWPYPVALGSKCAKFQLPIEVWHFCVCFNFSFPFPCQEVPQQAPRRQAARTCGRQHLKGAMSGRQQTSVLNFRKSFSCHEGGRRVDYLST